MSLTARVASVTSTGFPQPTSLYGPPRPPCLNEEPLTALAPAGSKSAGGGRFGSRDPRAQVEYLFVPLNHNHGSLAAQILAASGYILSLGRRNVVI